MELTISNCLLAVFLGVASGDGSLDGLHDELSEKELLGLADMHHHSISFRNTVEKDDHRRKKHMFPDYKHCCGDEASRNNTGMKETWKVVKKCVKQEKSKFNDLDHFVNPITDEFSCEKMKRDKSRHYCIAECIMKEVGALEEDGIVNKNKTKELLTTGISAKWLKEITENGVDKCAEKKDAEPNGEKLECNSRAANIKHCVWIEVILTCPKEHFDESEYCSRVKKAFEEMKN